MYLFAIEIIISAGLVVGFMYEEKIADFEQRLFEKWRAKK